MSLLPPEPRGPAPVGVAGVLTIDGRDLSLLLRNPPRGITVLRAEDGAVSIRHVRTGMLGLDLFILGFLAFTTWMHLAFIADYVATRGMEIEDPMTWHDLLPLSVLNVFFACLAAWSLFCRTTFHLDSDSLTIEWDVLGLRRRKTIRKDAITDVNLLLCGYQREEDDSFPGCGLKIVARRSTRALYRQPPDRVHWIGRLIARWAGGHFTMA